MQPEEKRPPRRILPPVFVEPPQRASNALSGAAIHQSDFFLLKRFGGEGVVVEIKAASQPPTAVQNERTDHCASGVALLFEQLSHRTKALIERLARKILHTVLKRIRTGQNGGVRRPGKRHLGDSTIEDNTIASQAIKNGSLNAGRAVASKMIGAHRVDRDENYVGGPLAAGLETEVKLPRHT